MNIVYKKNYKEPPIDRDEIYRYAGVGHPSAEDEALLSRCISELSGKLTYSVCHSEFKIEINNGLIDLGFCRVSSRDLEGRLSGCSKIILFAASIGFETDRRIRKYSMLSPSLAFMLSAYGNERIEALCDLFCNEISASGKKTKPRFSPGYGDLPLDLQRDVFSALDCQKRLGISLNESLLISPSKSVTAIIGII